MGDFDLGPERKNLPNAGGAGGVNYAPDEYAQYDKNISNGLGWFVDPSLQNSAIGQYAKYANAGYSGGPSMQAATVAPASLASAASVDQAKANEARAYQENLMAALADQAAGKGPSIAGMQMQQGLDQSLAQQAALLGSQKGSTNPALAQRMFGQQAGAANQALIGQQAVARQQEILSAQQGLAGLSSGVRSQDLSVAGQNAANAQQVSLANAGAQNAQSMAQAGFQQQAGQANLGAAMGTGAQNQQAGQYYFGQALDARERDRQALIARGGQELTGAQRQQDNDEADRKFQAGMASGAASGLAAVSDERAKTSIEPAEKPLSTFLQALGAHSYEYKDKSDGEGRYVSPMAQELEETPIGKSAVIETPRGKMVNYGRLAGTMLSAGAMHERRISKLEDAIAALGREGA